MFLLKSILLGIIQGVTEFLPVSSTAHLVLAERIMDIRPSFFLNVVLHSGTLIAVVAVYYKRIVELISGFVKGQADAKVYIYKLALVTVITAVVAIFMKSFIGEGVMQSSKLIGISLLVTAVVLFFSDKISSGSQSAVSISYYSIVLIGLAQGITALPGISRSGITIATCIFLQINRKEAVQFSFLLSVPIIIIALVYETLFSVSTGVCYSAAGILVGFVFAFLFGILAIKLMISLVSSRKLFVFSIYCLALGVFLFLI